MSYSSAKSSLHVLVIEESLDISNMLKKALFCTGHSATVFHNATDALEKLRSDNHYDAVISDCFLNEQNTQSQSTLAGMALIDALHAIKQLPVLIWSLCADKLQSDVQNRMQVTLLRKPEENLPHIFKWLSNIKKEENYLNDTFPIFQLIYASKAIDTFTENDLMDMLNTSRQFNQARYISGVLIYHNDRFLQVLEGEKSVVEELYYEHIAKDKRHIELNLLTQSIAEKRAFRDWEMGFFGNNSNEDYGLLGLTDFDKHPAGQFFKENLSQSQKELLGIH